nr:uncharacterized protein LOC112757152 [Arachis hypogaea]
MEKNQAAAIHTQPSPQKELETEEGANWEEANYLGNSSRQANDPYSKTYNSEKNPRGKMKKVRWEECKSINLSSEEGLKEEFSIHSEDDEGKLRNDVREIEEMASPEQRNEQKEKEYLEPFVSQAPFPQRLKGSEEGRSYSRFLDIFATFSVNIPFIKILQQMPTYIKCMKELLTKKGTLKGGQTVTMNKKCSALIKKDILMKKKDPGSFHIPCAIGETKIDRGFCDLGASKNVMPLSLMKKLQISELRSTDVIVQLADKTQKKAEGLIENAFKPVHESEQESKELKEEHIESPLKENRNEPQ